ncbi:MAG: DUF4365 domain-containing protein [Archangium sp.]|nr:DUF4365 domain-containing protein [Archangium sp.]
MSDIKLQGDFGVAYVKAVAHAAGYFVELAGRAADDAGIDLTIFALNATKRRQAPRLDVQVKTTVEELVGDPFPYDVTAKNYDELRDDGPNNLPRILVVVSVPRDQREWLSASESQLVLRKCGYWVSLRGQPPKTNTSEVRIRIRRSDCFHPDNLKAIMAGLMLGGTL